VVKGFLVAKVKDIYVVSASLEGGFLEIRPVAGE